MALMNYSIFRARNKIFFLFLHKCFRKHVDKSKLVAVSEMRDTGIPAKENSAQILYFLVGAFCNSLLPAGQESEEFLTLCSFAIHGCPA